MQYSAHISLAAAADFEWNKKEGKKRKIGSFVEKRAWVNFC